MTKTLLATFPSPHHFAEEAPTITERENLRLRSLMRELKPHLRSAAEDLLQPRPQAITALLEKILKPNQ